MSSDLTVGLLMTAAGAMLVTATLPALKNSSDTASRTFERQVDILERGANGGAGGGGAGGIGGAGGMPGFDVGSNMPSPTGGQRLSNGNNANVTSAGNAISNGGNTGIAGSNAGIAGSNAGIAGSGNAAVTNGSNAAVTNGSNAAVTNGSASNLRR